MSHVWICQEWVMSHIYDTAGLNAYGRWHSIWKLHVYLYVAFYQTTHNFSYTTYNLLKKLKRYIIHTADDIHRQSLCKLLCLQPMANLCHRLHESRIRRSLRPTRSRSRWQSFATGCTNRFAIACMQYIYIYIHIYIYIYTCIYIYIYIYIYRFAISCMQSDCLHIPAACSRYDWVTWLLRDFFICVSWIIHICQHTNAITWTCLTCSRI